MSTKPGFILESLRDDANSLPLYRHVYAAATSLLKIGDKKMTLCKNTLLKFVFAAFAWMVLAQPLAAQNTDADRIPRLSSDFTLTYRVEESFVGSEAVLARARGEAEKTWARMVKDGAMTQQQLEESRASFLPYNSGLKSAKVYTVQLSLSQGSVLCRKIESDPTGKTLSELRWLYDGKDTYSFLLDTKQGEDAQGSNNPDPSIDPDVDRLVVSNGVNTSFFCPFPVPGVDIVHFPLLTGIEQPVSNGANPVLSGKAFVFLGSNQEGVLPTIAGKTDPDRQGCDQGGSGTHGQQQGRWAVHSMDVLRSSGISWSISAENSDLDPL